MFEQLETGLSFLQTFIVVYYRANIFFGFLMSLVFLCRGESLPLIVKDLFLFGKYSVSAKARSIIRYTDVPKQWFTHFYLFGMLMTSAAIALLQLGLWKIPVDRNWPTLMTVLCLLFLQVSRRYYECRCVSIFSAGTMNAYLYFVGMFFYSSMTYIFFLDAGHMYEWTCFQLMGFITVCLSIQYLQFQVSLSLARLRRTDKGTVAHTKHVIPQEGLFQLVSSPHYLLEILIYTLFLCMLGPRCFYYLHIYGFIIANQLLCSITAHAWYKKEFPQYPPQRKALIPYVF